MQWTWAVLRHELFQWIGMGLSDQLLPLVANYDINNLISFINVSYDWDRRNDRDWYVDSIFLSFRSYLPSGLSMRKQRFDPIHFDKRASWNSNLQRTGNQWNDTTVKWNDSEMTGSQFAGGLISNSASLCSTVFTALFHPLWLNCSYCLQTNQILEATGQPPNHPTPVTA